MILFSDLELKLFYVSQSVTNMINRFENDLTNESAFTKHMIIDEIKGFTTFQYLFFVKETLKYECSINNLELMFEIGHHFKSKEIVSLTLFKQNFDFKEYGINLSDLEILNPFQKISLFMRFQNSSFAYKCDSYMNQIRHSLEGILLNKTSQNLVLVSHYYRGLKFVFSVREDCFTINTPNSTDDEILKELEIWNYFLEDEWYGIYNERHYLYHPYEDLLEQLLTDEIQSIKKMTYFYVNNVEYKIYEPLIVDDLSKWKASVTKEILSSQTDFNDKKSFYLECLNILKQKIQIDRITKLEINYQFSEEDHLSSSPYIHNTYLLSDLKNWIKSQFPKYQAAKKQNQILSLIKFTKDFKVIQKAFEVLFQKNNALDKDQQKRIKSFILRNCDCLNMPQNSDPLKEKIIFQNDDIKDDFIKVFIYLKNLRIILSNKTSFLDKIAKEFRVSKGDYNGLGKTTLRTKFSGYRNNDEIIFNKKNVEIKKEIENILKGMF